MDLWKPEDLSGPRRVREIIRRKYVGPREWQGGEMGVLRQSGFKDVCGGGWSDEMYFLVLVRAFFQNYLIGGSGRIKTSDNT